MLVSNAVMKNMNSTRKKLVILDFFKRACCQNYFTAHCMLLRALFETILREACFSGDLRSLATVRKVQVVSVC